MAEVRPFNGLLYDGNKINGDYSAVIAPPYDVISDDMRDKLYNRNDYNIVRLILGKSCETNGAQDNKYTRAGKLLTEWEKEGVMVRDNEKSFYVYVQEYKYDGKTLRRIGFVGLMEISDDVLPHEYTLAKPKKDRMNLIKEVKGNLSPIFSLYPDKEGSIRSILEKGIEGKKPILDIAEDGVRHIFWKFSDEKAVNDISSQMNGKKTFIADGHHRYEVARSYRDMFREQEGYKGEADHIMMYFTELDDIDNLTVVATHRVVKKMPNTDNDDLIKTLGKYFDIELCENLDELEKCLKRDKSSDNVFGFLNDNKYFFLMPKDEKALVSLIKENKSEEWKKMDVSVLHAAIFDVILSVDCGEGNLTYVKTPEEAESLVKSGTHQSAFLLNPTRVEQLKAVAELGEMMPQKSTYFYPKLLSGLVINKFN